MLASGVPPKDVAKNLGVSIPTLYRWLPGSAHDGTIHRYFNADAWD
ncbi:helix-turn-helix domain-containing protein [Xylella fastidiosa]